jgi:hypothetical protein
MKSGTSTLFLYLSQHPEILRSRRKEPNFFSSKDQWSKGEAHYARQWPSFDPAVHRYALEASTNYTKAPGSVRVAKRIRRFGRGRDVRFIYILRNPIDRIESHIAHNIAKGRVTFEAASERAPQGSVEVSRYAYQLDTFRAGLGGDPEILLLDFDALRRTPLAVAARCAAFLGLDPAFAFSEVAPANTRKTTNRADEFRLGADQRAALAEELRPDVVARRDRYGFDGSGWGLG